MTRPIRVDAPDRRAAASLADHLLGVFEAEVVPEGTRFVVEVVPDRPFDRLVADVIPAVESWLASTGLESTTVLVDGRLYTVVKPG